MIFGPTVVNLLGFKVNILERSSIISFGPVQQVDIFMSNKRNQGLGEENGDLSQVYLPVNFVNDTDLLDSNSTKASVV